MMASPDPTPERREFSQSELAQHLGLSDWTVSRAINGHPAVKAATRERVLRAMQDVGFQPNPLARGLRGKGTGLVGVIFTELRNSILLEKLASFENFLHEHDLRSLLVFAGQDAAAELRALADFRRLHVDAVVLIQSILTKAQCAKPLSGIKWVHVDPQSAHPAPVVGLDREKGVELLIEHLFSLGHRHFGTLGILDINRWRWPGLLKALTKRGLDPSQHLKQYLPLRNEEPSYAMGIHAAEQVLADSEAPTALIAINDRVALAAAQHLTRHGASVPGRFSVTGFDHLEVAEHLHPTLTTIDHRTHQLMEAAGNLLLNRLKKTSSNTPSETLFIEPQLIVGESTGTSRRS